MGSGSRAWRRRQAMKAKKQRQIVGLKWVEAASPPPFTNGPRHLTGSAARGKAYESKVTAQLREQVEAGALRGELYIGPWFKFEDEAGLGLAQPDALLVFPEFTVIVEAKLKQTIAAHPQLALYGELATKLFDMPWIGVQAFRYPSFKRNNRWIDDLSVVELGPEGANGLGSIFEWHFLAC